MNPFKFSSILALSLLFFLFFSNNSIAISILEEKKIADKFVKAIAHQQIIMKDPLVNNMVEQVGRQLLSSIKNQPFDYSFYVVNADVFNAFASPGAHIFFYRGLITSLDSIDEFAGIVGHEIAHAASRHVSESIDRSKYVNIGTLVGIIAGALIGSQSGGDAGAAIMKGSMAISQTAMFAFTRENETEADEKGIMFLKNSCFDPKGLMSGLMKIREADFRGVEKIPEYVKTHPGTGNRISHAEVILSGYKTPEDKRVCSQDFRFDMIKYRLLGIYADVDSTFNKLILAEKENSSNAAFHYGLGLLYERKFMPDKAMFHLKKALSINLVDPMILLEMGRLYLANGSPQKALQVLDGIESDPVMGVMARFHQACAQLELHELDYARDGFKFVVNRAPLAYPQAYLKLAKIYSIEREKGLSAYNLGFYYSIIGKIETAMHHFDVALETLIDEELIEKTKKLLSQLEQRAKQRRRPS